MYCEVQCSRLPTVFYKSWNLKVCLPCLFFKKVRIGRVVLLRYSEIGTVKSGHSGTPFLSLTVHNTVRQWWHFLGVKWRHFLTLSDKWNLTNWYDMLPGTCPCNSTTAGMRTKNNRGNTSNRFHSCTFRALRDTSSALRSPLFLPSSPL